MRVGLSGHGGHSEEPGFYSEPAVLSRDGTKPDLLLRALCWANGLHWAIEEARGQETCAQAGMQSSGGQRWARITVSQKLLMHLPRV